MEQGRAAMPKKKPEQFSAGQRGPEGANPMKILAFPFDARGFRHELIERQGAVCLVKATRIGKKYYCYEVVKLKTYSDRTMFGDFVPAHEGYPGDEDWGTYCFTYRPDELVKARQQL